MEFRNFDVGLLVALDALLTADEDFTNREHWLS